MANLTHLPLFLILCAVAAAAQFRNWGGSSASAAKEAAFRAFQRNYLVVYLVMMAADWLQGPYVYALYRSYGFSIGDIGVLFIAGFGASAVFGVFVGSVADTFGRKLTCLAFGALYSLSCVTKHYNNFSILMVGRLLGGVSTSILFSVFDAWLVHEHHHRKFPEELLGETFSAGTFGNGVVAILAGLLASWAADIWGLVAPFDLSMMLLLLGSAIILLSWAENYGGQAGNAGSPDQAVNSLGAAVGQAFETMMQQSEVWQCGMVQSLFEGAMYTFVFMWTPALPEDWNLGLIFACYMVCMMIGSAIFSEMCKMGIPLSRALVLVFCVAAPALALPAVFSTPAIRLAAFLVFETVCGVYFPAYYTLRSQIVPDKGRATILNFYRVPLNIIVVVVCTQTENWSIPVVFALCTAMLVMGGWLAHQIHNTLQRRSSEAPKTQSKTERSASEELDQLTANTEAGRGPKPNTVGKSSVELEPLNDQ